MAMSNGVSMGSIVIGCSLLVLILISVISGGVVVSKMTSPAAVSIGFWGFYFAIPGVFSILAGVKKLSSLLAVALATHILGIILGIVGLSLGAAFWAILASNCTPTFSYHQLEDYCTCIHGDLVSTYEASCSDLDTVRGGTGAVTITFVLFTIVTFIGSVYGCVGTCCAPQEPQAVIVTTAQPGTVVMTTQSYPAYPGYPATNQAANQHPPPYAQGHVVMDTKPQF